MNDLLIFVLLHVSSAGLLQAICRHHAPPGQLPLPMLLGGRQANHKAYNHMHHLLTRALA